jgi:hypothetical protein
MGAAAHTGRGQLGADAGRVDERLQVVEHAQNRPDAVARAQRLDLLGTFRGQLPAVLLPGLELVHEFVHHVPQPAVGQLQHIRGSTLASV